MEKFTLMLGQSTIDMLFLLAKHENKTVGTLIQELALERYVATMLDDREQPASEPTRQSA